MIRGLKKLGAIAGGLLALGQWTADTQAQGFLPQGMPGGWQTSAPYPEPIGVPMHQPGMAPMYQPGMAQQVMPVSAAAYGQPSHQVGEANAFEGVVNEAAPRPYRFKLRGEYMWWRIGNPNINSILVTSTNTPVFDTNAGQLDQPDTIVLFGPQEYSYGEMKGGRVTGGLSLWGALPPLEVTGMWIDKTTVRLFAASSDGSAISPVLSRPFLDVSQAGPVGTGQEQVLSSGFPGLLAGDIGARASGSLWGIEANFICNVFGGDTVSIDLILGYRHANLSEDFEMFSRTQPVVAGVNLPFNAVNQIGFGLGFQTLVFDRFHTINQFDGANIGVRGFMGGRWLQGEVELKCAIGNTNARVDIGGESVLLHPGFPVRPPVIEPGGFLAVKSNSGSFHRNEFSVIPEVNGKLALQITRNLKIFSTYNVFYWSDVARPGDQLSNVIDARQIPTHVAYDPRVKNGAGPQILTPPQPSISLRDFWGYGFGFGVEIGF
ncbi:MAG: BBP7 family outer membrane beta-barrel protein [Gemmataceae bacterium]|nr:BBP7 family outer membrane beta-barrel protein [Gemmataceae bacterium]MCI0738868.1 BBP7 family outer membrane beta-barrel protein [Gemmataceae bacterium]